MKKYRLIVNIKAISEDVSLEKSVLDFFRRLSEKGLLEGNFLNCDVNDKSEIEKIIQDSNLPSNAILFDINPVKD